MDFFRKLSEDVGPLFLIKSRKDVVEEINHAVEPWLLKQGPWTSGWPLGVRHRQPEALGQSPEVPVLTTMRMVLYCQVEVPAECHQASQQCRFEFLTGCLFHRGHSLPCWEVSQHPCLLLI